MATTMGPRSGGRSRASNGRDAAGQGEQQNDLLTAAILGLAVGAGIAMLVRGRRKRTPRALAREAGMMAGEAAGRAGRRGMKWAAKRGEEMLGRIPMDDMGDALSDYAHQAREAIDDTVTRELNDLRKAIRRRRKHLGI